LAPPEPTSILQRKITTQRVRGFWSSGRVLTKISSQGGGEKKKGNKPTIRDAVTKGQDPGRQGGGGGGFCNDLRIEAREGLS